MTISFSSFYNLFHSSSRPETHENDIEMGIVHRNDNPGFPEKNSQLTKISVCLQNPESTASLIDSSKENGVNLNRITKNNGTNVNLLQWYAQIPEPKFLDLSTHERVIQLLKSAGLSIHHQKDQFSPLAWGLLYGEPSQNKFEALINCGADLFAPFPTKTPLIRNGVTVKNCFDLIFSDRCLHHLIPCVKKYFYKRINETEFLKHNCEKILKFIVKADDPNLLSELVRKTNPNLDNQDDLNTEKSKLLTLLVVQALQKEEFNIIKPLFNRHSEIGKLLRSEKLKLGIEIFSANLWKTAFSAVLDSNTKEAFEALVKYGKHHFGTLEGENQNRASTLTELIEKIIQDAGSRKLSMERTLNRTSITRSISSSLTILSALIGGAGAGLGHLFTEQPIKESSNAAECALFLLDLYNRWNTSSKPLITCYDTNDHPLDYDGRPDDSHIEECKHDETTFRKYSNRIADALTTGPLSDFQNKCVSTYDKNNKMSSKNHHDFYDPLSDKGQAALNALDSAEKMHKNIPLSIGLACGAVSALSMMVYAYFYRKEAALTNHLAVLRRNEQFLQSQRANHLG